MCNTRYRIQHSVATRRRGASLVEFAFVLPVFLLIVLGIIEFGRAMMVSQLLTHAARESARASTLEGATNNSITALALNLLESSGNIEEDDVTVTISVTPAPGNSDPNNEVANATAGDLCQIQIYVPFSEVAYIPGNYLGGKLLRAACTMRRE
ncbi:MAG: TadE/TadG family type IV pilus assembly protein [Planctomycetaceae bacterium]